MGLFLLIGVGCAAVRGGLLPLSATGVLTDLLLKVTMIRPFDPGFVRDALTIVGISTALFLLYAAISAGLVRAFRVSEGRQGIWMLCVTFCNNGFMGFPVAYALFGDEGLILAVLINIPFNFLLYSVGIWMVCKDAPKSGARGGFSLRKVVISPLNVGMVLGLIFYFAQLSVPEAIFTPIQHLSNVTTPLSMLVTGMNLAQGKASDVIRDRSAITSSLTRLLVCPVIAWAIMRLIPGLDTLVMGVTLVIMAMPSPAATPIIGEQYNGNVQLGARVVFLSSLLCIVTLPLVSLLL